MVDKLEILRDIEVGERVAEEEADNLEKYFVETDQWRQMRSGKIDVVYGPKGSGKSALYTLLNKKEGELFDDNILVVSAENVSGSTVFRSIMMDPPPSEMAFIYLWKLYCLTLVAQNFRDIGLDNKEATSLVSCLEEVKVLPATGGLPAIFRAVSRYLKGWTNRDAAAVEHAITIDAQTGSPTWSRKTHFSEKSDDQNLDDIPVDDLFNVANRALEKEGYFIWLLFDRLDVAFAGSPDLERNALRALFRVYNDVKGYGNVSLKIFVRDDIWRNITEGGFREASHIIKTVNIAWTEESLLNLIVLRLLNNPSLVKFTGVNPEEIKEDYDKQKELFYRLVPEQVDTGKNPYTFNWMVSRTVDGTGKPVPREVIHLLDVAKNLQIQKLERGAAAELPGLQLFERSSFKEALPEVSKIRFDQTLLVEYEDVVEYVKVLEGEKCEHGLDSLQRLWQIDADRAGAVAKRLVEIGFFEQRGSKEDPLFWVPFLYRSALNLVQGKAT